VRLLIAWLLVFGGFLGGVAFNAERETAALLGSVGFVAAWAGAWLMTTRVVRRRG
jgi:hypothetical protein